MSENKKTSKKGIIATICALLLGTTGIVGWNLTKDEKTTAKGFENVEPIRDTVAVDVESSDFKFNFADAKIINKPNSLLNPISDVEGLNDIIAQFSNLKEQKDIELPAIAIYFDLNSSKLSSKSETVLNRLSTLYKKTSKDNSIIVNGYTCNIGTDEANNELSKERAIAVKQQLVKEGIETSKIDSHWFGKTKNNEFNLNDISEYRRVLISFN